MVGLGECCSTCVCFGGHNDRCTSELDLGHHFTFFITHDIDCQRKSCDCCFIDACENSTESKTVFINCIVHGLS